MKQAFLQVDEHVCPRGKVVRIFFVPTLPQPDNYVVGIWQDGVLMAHSEPMMKEAAYEIADMQADLPGVHGDSSWRAVLTRLLGNKEESRGQWKGSNAQFASCYPVGTWLWLDALMTHRAQTFGQSKAA